MSKKGVVNINNIIDDVKILILNRYDINKYLMSMVNKYWNTFCMKQAKIAQDYKQFKALCKTHDTLSIVHSRKYFHDELTAFYMAAFGPPQTTKILLKTTTAYHHDAYFYALCGAIRGNRIWLFMKLVKENSIEEAIRSLILGFSERYIFSYYVGRGGNVAFIEEYLKINHESRYQVITGLSKKTQYRYCFKIFNL
jgi:hypothetical protein